MKKEDVHNICDMHVPLASCSPKLLFCWDTKNKWRCIKDWYQFISAVLERTQGATRLQATFHGNLRSWLEKHDMKWTLGDTETCAYNLRTMIREVARRKRDHLGRAPRRFESLQPLIDQVVVAPKDDAEPKSCDPPLNDVDLDDVAALIDEVPIEVSSCDEVHALQTPSKRVTEDDIDKLLAEWDTPEKPVEHAPSGPGVLLDEELEALAQTCSEAAPPLPQEYIKMFKRPAAKIKKRPAAAMAPDASEVHDTKILKRPAAAPDASEEHEHEFDEKLKMRYVAMDAPPKVVHKRVHSHFWHRAREVGDSQYAGRQAAIAIDRWQQLRKHSGMPV